MASFEGSHTFAIRLQAFLPAVVATILLCLTVSTGMASPTHTFLVDTYAPYYHWEGDSPKGVLIDIAEEAFQRMGVKPHYVKANWARNLFELREGRFTGAIAGFKLPQREEYCTYPEEPLCKAESWVATLKKPKLSIRSLEDLRFVTVGVTEGYSYGTVFDAMKGLSKIVLHSEKILVKLLINGRIDAILGNPLTLRHHAEKMGSADQLAFPLKTHDGNLYVLFSRKDKEARQLAAAFSDALKEMKRDGTYDRIGRKWNYCFTPAQLP